MSDESRSCIHEYARKVEFCEPELRYASKALEKKPIFALEIPYPLLREWHRIISEEPTEKYPQVMLDHQHLLDYVALLQVAIRDHALFFSDDKTKRNEMNKALAKRAGSVASLYRTTKGRAKEALNVRVKKFHIFEGEVKSSQDLQREMTRLEMEINEWRKKCNNIEQEKEELFKEMTQTVQEKDRIISHLQNTNKELEDYVANLEKLSLNVEYKGKPLASSKNKGRTLKNFLTRAETALWFSKFFGLDIESILVKESDTGVKHTIAMKQSLPCDLSEEQETNLKYDSLSVEEKKQVEEILFLLDKFCVGDSFFHELTMVTDGLPKSYLIQQCRANLNKLCHIDSLPGTAPGAKVSAVKELIKEHVQEYLNKNPTTKSIQIKINGDGARMTRNSNFVLLSFSILQTGDEVMKAKGNRTLAILNGKEDYSSMKESFGGIFSEINSMITEAKIMVSNTEIETEFFLGGDYKFILTMLGLNAATANYACAWCKIHKDDRWKVYQHFSYFNSKPLSRSLQEIKKMSEKKKDNYGCCEKPLLDIELDHIIVMNFTSYYE